MVVVYAKLSWLFIFQRSCSPSSSSSSVGVVIFSILDRDHGNRKYVLRISLPTRSCAL